MSAEGLDVLQDEVGNLLVAAAFWPVEDRAIACEILRGLRGQGFCAARIRVIVAQQRKINLWLSNNEKGTE